MLRQDLRWAFQIVRRHPSLSLVIVLSLGISLGASTAVFSVFNAFLLRPLGIGGIDRVVRVYENYAAPGQPPIRASVTGANFYQWLEHNQVFEGIAAATFRHLHSTGAGDHERVAGAAVTWNFFRVLRIAPLLGRDFVPEEDRPGSRRVAIVGHAWWQTRLGGDPAVVGRVLTLDGEPVEVIGVMPRSLRHPYDADLWVPLALEHPQMNGWGHYVPARLRPGVSLERAQAEMTLLVQRLAGGAAPVGTTQGVLLAPLHGELLRDLPRLLAVLLGGAGVLLLIACVNVSNLLLAQSLRLSGEAAVRTALGATRGRLVRQFLTLPLLLGLMGGALGLLLGFWSVGPLVALASVQEAVNEFDIEPRIDWRTLVFTGGVSLGAGLVFGLLPALRASAGNVAQMLKEEARPATLSRRGQRLLGSFVVVEVGLALVLLVVAALTFQGMRRVVYAPRGFDPAQVLTFEVAMPEAQFPDPLRKVEVIREALRRLRGVPGITAAGATTTQPLFAGTYTLPFNPEGRPARNPMGAYLAHDRAVTPGYFAALDIPILKGRGITEEDARDRPMVAVISQSMAERHWPARDPIGQRFKPGPYDGPGPWITVVGVAGNLEETSAAEAPELRHDAMYRSYQQATPRFASITFTLETEGDPASLPATARRLLSHVDRRLAVFDVLTMEQRLAERTRQERFSAWLYGLLGGMGLLLAALGIYGILSFSVAQRLREIGVRSAMGARPADVRALVLGRALVLTLAGIASGLAATVLVTRVLPHHVLEAGRGDPVVLAAAALTLLAIAAGASYVPARRAARVSPMEALRERG